MRIRYAIATLTLMLTVLPALAQKDLPYGWHELRGGELAGRNPKSIMLHADFDGDGKPDTAVILADDRGGAEGLFAFLTSTSRWVKLDSGKVSEFQDRWIRIHTPGGILETDCAKKKNEDGCKDGQPEKLTLTLPGVDLFTKLNSQVLFYWDRDSKSFREVPIAIRFVE